MSAFLLVGVVVHGKTKDEEISCFLALSVRLGYNGGRQYVMALHIGERAGNKKAGNKKGGVHASHRI